MTSKEIKKFYKRHKLIFAAAVLLLMVLALSMAGATESLFTDGSAEISNKFIFGTVLIEAEKPASEPALTVTAGNGFSDIIEKEYTVTSSGSKSVYVRAFFDGYWEKAYHANTATVTANYGALPLVDTDQGHFFYLNSSQMDTGGPNTYRGFTDRNYLFSNLVFTETANNDSILNLNGQNNTGSPDSNSLSNSSSPAPTCDPADPGTWEGPLVTPVLGAEAYPDYFTGGSYFQNPLPEDLRPEDCDLQAFKVDGSHTQITSGDTFSDNGFEVTIYVHQDPGDGNYYFSFMSNFPVYHVYAKGGQANTEHGNLYNYLPLYQQSGPGFGVYKDCNLSQPGGNWSHIVFYYCEVEDDPGIELKKMVSVDGGTTWLDASVPDGPVLQEGIAPQFKFTITNTGNVTLTNITLNDDVIDLGNQSAVPDLAPGETHEVVIEYLEWYEPLNKDNITIELCSNMDKWVPQEPQAQGPQPLGTYFYYTEILKNNDTVPICVKLDFSAVENGYKSGEFVLYSYFEAVQASNNMIESNWPQDHLWWLPW